MTETSQAQALLLNLMPAVRLYHAPLLLSYQQLVGQLNWNDHQNGVTTKEACAFTKQLSPLVFPIDQPAAMVLPGGAATLGPTATLGTIMGMTVGLHSEASGRSKKTS